MVKPAVTLLKHWKWLEDKKWRHPTCSKRITHNRKYRTVAIRIYQHGHSYGISVNMVQHRHIAPHIKSYRQQRKTFIMSHCFGIYTQKVEHGDEWQMFCLTFGDSFMCAAAAAVSHVCIVYIWIGYDYTGRAGGRVGSRDMKKENGFICHKRTPQTYILTYTSINTCVPRTTAQQYKCTATFSDSK